ncbi:MULTISPECIES: NnrS family protein [Colwellia]|uniref:Short-chain dehydrogenase n=1 Tax=Colwellia marinimaniae TaxID=1513592 RepID=A0ABQ0MQN0_9GAMM|nr:MULTISPECIES: NnrS family protein [Colwellia]GAW94685.1 short-chain dehydrogenase [Colwellia marinimaniae]
MQITDLKTEQKIPPLLRLGFRPFFLSGALFSVFAVTLWLLMYQGTISLSPLGGGYWWHIHEMIFGFGGAIIAGFLLTAVQNWTGARGAQGNTLLALWLLWLAGRILLIVPELLGEKLSSLIDLAFLPTVAFVLAKPIIAIKQYRNLFFVPLLALFTLANAEMHLALYYPTSFNIAFAGYAGVLLVTFLMSVMAGRVAPMFTANGTKTPKVTPLPWLDKAANGSLAIAMFSLLLQPVIGFSGRFFGVLLIIAGILQTIRWLRWRPWLTLNVPLLWSLHTAMKFICFGLLLLGLSYLLPEVPSKHIWHLLTIGGMGGLILAMIARVSLGHTGRPLTPPKSMSIAFILISLAALVRTFGPWGLPEKTLLFIDISSGLWIGAFAIFIVGYAPMLISVRKDGRPG